MRTIALALLIAAPAFAQPPAAPTPPTPPTPSAEPVQPAPAAAAPPAPQAPAAMRPKPGDISPEAQAVLDRATAVYRGAKGYRESALTTLHQRATGIAKDAEPPADQASVTTFVWAGPDKFTFETPDIGLHHNGKEVTIVVKGLGQYVQREAIDDDKAIFAKMVDTHPVYQALTGKEGGEGMQAFGRFLSVKDVKADEVRGVKGKRLSGAGVPPLPGYEVPGPMTMFFADDTGLLVQATYDLRAVMQSQYDRTYAAMKEAGQQTGPKVRIQQFDIIRDWTEAKVEPEGVKDDALAFKPGPRDTKVDDFNLAEGDASVLHATLNRPAPEFTTTTLDGKAWSLKEQRGSVVLLQFWSAASTMSLKSLTVFNSMDMEFKNKGVVIVGVNEDHSTMAAQAKRAAAAKLAVFPMLADPDKAIGNAFRVMLLPTTILIDKEGVVRSITTDFDAADQVLVAAKIGKLLRGEPLEEGPKPAPFQLPTRPGSSPAPAPGAPAATPAPAQPAPSTGEPAKTEPKKQ